MKYAIIIPDGAADLPLDDLGGRTPFEAAKIPTIDSIVAMGRLGTVRNVPDGYPAGSDVAIMSLLGYDPTEYYSGRAPLEAAAMGIKVTDDEWIFRCNLVTIIDDIMEDYSAGHISTEEASAIIAALQSTLNDTSVHLYPGVAYRHIMTVSGDMDVTTTPPHDILGQGIARHLPRGEGSEVLLALMDRARYILADCDINAVRKDLGENPATDIWLWGQGKMPKLDPFFQKYGVHGAAISAVDLVRGIARLMDWDVLTVEGATGYVDTNYEGKGRMAVQALDHYDMVCVHVEGTDEAGHNADFKGKIHALEQIDKYIVAPVLERLKKEGDDWRILILPDHPTPCDVRTHTREAVPFVIAGRGIESGPAERKFTEAQAAQSDLHVEKGCNLMEYFLTVY
ncbi:MAG TPA: cofactor-independent phosphoglycerate mutase [Phycisphaerae bacterium]|nr:cofactor-independent phosphoglycerate mutase [Phycisphaerae bacterium]